MQFVIQPPKVLTGYISCDRLNSKEVEGIENVNICCLSGGVLFALHISGAHKVRLGGFGIEYKYINR